MSMAARWRINLKHLPAIYKRQTARFRLPRVEYTRRVRQVNGDFGKKSIATLTVALLALAAQPSSTPLLKYDPFLLPPTAVARLTRPVMAGLPLFEPDRLPLVVI